MPKSISKSYSVIYYAGGTQRGSWHKVLGRFDRETADAEKAELRRTGYYALVHDAEQLARLGMPEGAPSDFDEFDESLKIRF